MRAWNVPSLALTVSLLSLLACPARQPGGEGEGEGESPNGDVCDIGGLDLAVPYEDGVRVDGTPPDLSCVGSPEEVDPGIQVTLEGCIDIFGVGESARAETEVAVFAADDDPKSGTPIATGRVFVRNQAAGLDCNGTDQNEPACLAAGCDSGGYYRLSSTIPTHVPLTMRITHPTDGTIIDTYLWGLVFRNDEAVDGVVNYEAALIYSSTYSSIPTLSGRQIEGNQDLTDGIGKGVIAGEIHDCSDTIVANAVVGMEAFDATMTIAYFDSELGDDGCNDDDPKPDLTRLSTACDGLYAILNVPADVEQRVTAGIRDPACTGDDCTCLSLGERTVKAYADSVSIVTLRGDFPVVP